MTVAALPSTASYVEDGVTTSFPVPFRFKSASDLVVERIAGGVATALSLGVDYSVTGGSTDAGGTLTRTAATAGATLRIARRTARAQPMVYTNGDRFPAKSHEEALDRAILITQELDASVDDIDARALMLPPSETAPQLPAASARRGGVLTFDPVSGAALVKPEALFAPGAAGPAGPTYLTLPEFKAAPISNRKQTLFAPGIARGDFYFVLGDYSGLIDEVRYIAADGVSPAVGAWVREDADGVDFDGRSIGRKLRETVSITDARFAGGAKGNGTDDRPAIQAAIDAVWTAGGGEVLVPQGTYRLKYGLTPRSGVTLRGQNRTTSILKMMDGAVDNVIGIDYLVEAQVAARAAGKTLTRLSSPGFGPDLSEQEARETGGYAGFGIVDWHVVDVTVDGNKANCPENGNFLAASAGLTGTFYAGDMVTSSSGGQAQIGAVFPNGASPPGIAIRPRTVTGTFNVGDTVTKVGGGASLVVSGRQADDAYQQLVVLQAATRSSVRRCILKNSVFQAVTIYNFTNDCVVDGNVFIENNKAGTVYPGGRVNVFCDFDNNNIRITHNSFYGGQGYGVVVTEGGGMTDGVLIEGNRFYNTIDDAILIQQKNTSIVQGVRVTKNQIAGCNNVAIRVNGTGTTNGVLGAVVEGNAVRDSAFGVLFQNRVFQSNASGNSFLSIAGVELDIGADFVAKGNSASGNTGQSSVTVDRLSKGLQSAWVQGGQARVSGAGDIAVGTTPVTIFAVQDANLPALFVVGGEAAAGGFADVVTLANGVANAVNSSITFGAPAVRSYSRSGNTLRLAMASGTYTVRIAGKEVTP
ncbi:glycosyl hydrolase family 28-related protein [Sphingomonas ginsenosidimutans]|uniref:glycosyl hydrolase family 28-related protein n=1 Tax=Sphingomonas ginsenosidimutans TaxID=862134 RepID=UPI001D581FED|nr:glycosyl hydrolase family 28-related protein [Sphingomonas ginsenosidimutans]MBY0301234.1 right-handed parallel beta-helix repeat-containing protein [Sphingomonas ginsenosidimutans]